MPSRSFQDAGYSKYRWGFNGKEDDEDGGFQDYGMRGYLTKVGRFLSVDPLAPEYPWYTPYQFAGNKPIVAIDLDGAEELYTPTALNKNQFVESKHGVFLRYYAFFVYESAKKEGLSIHGSFFIVAKSALESGWGTSGNNNPYGLVGRNGPMRFKTLYDAEQTWSEAMNDPKRFLNLKTLLQSANYFTSDDINHIASSGPYANNTYAPYNYDANSSEPTKIWRVGTPDDQTERETGMMNYGWKVIENVGTVIATWRIVIEQELGKINKEINCLNTMPDFHSKQVQDAYKRLLDKKVKYETIYNEINTTWLGDTQNNEGKYEYKYYKKDKDTKEGVKYKKSNKAMGSGDTSTFLENK